jgi:hypothetical protein
MKGDFSRSTFRRSRHYSRVLMQQGRVQLDADWNEQLAIDTHLERTTRLDVIGACGSPKAAPGFELGVTPDGHDLTISPGRIYVGGTLCELETSPIAIKAAKGGALLLAQVEADGHSLAAGDWVSLVADGVKPVLARLATVKGEAVTFAAPKPSNASLAGLVKAGNATLTWVCTYLTQPDFPGQRPKAIEVKGGGYLAYLDVWQQHVTALEDGEIRETALGGPDTATRARTVWQVKLFPTRDGEKASCKSVPSSFPTASSGRLAARAEPQTQPTDVCTIPPGAGFRRLENQLYRVEVHEPGELSGGKSKATFKWSRENGSVVVRWLADKGSTAVVDSLGRDEVLGFSAGNLVELTSSLDELAGNPGTLATVQSTSQTDADGSLLTLGAPPPARPGDEFHPKVRRWENEAGLATGWIGLEDGVEVEFAPGFYNTGDYWLIPARTATGDVEWPTDGVNPLLRPPLGIEHSYCKLAALVFSERWRVAEICRPVFPPLTGLPTGGPAADPGIHVLDVRTGGRSLGNDTSVPSVTLGRTGLLVVCDADVEPGTVDSKPDVLVTIDVPYPTTQAEIAFWKTSDGGPFGTIPVTLNAATIWDGADKAIVWKPFGPAASILNGLFARFPKQKSVLAHLTVKGNFIYEAGNAQINLDGEVFGVLENSTLAVALPQSGDGRRGGDLEMWFRLVPDQLVVGVLESSPVLVEPALQQAAAEVVGLATDGPELSAAVPADVAVDDTAKADVAGAQERVDAAGLQGKELTAVIDENLAGAADLLVQQMQAAGIKLNVVPLPADEIAAGAKLPDGQKADLVIAGRDVVETANEQTPGLLPAQAQVQL